MAEPRARRLRVYGGNLDGCRYAIMATTSFKEFSRATRINRDYGGETKAADAVAAALARPGVILVRPLDSRGPFAELAPADKEGAT